ncbi:hypothetical protein WA026_008215 [Henosepilachna vigintioctopunctata]|uniref:Uncharacterized protein n=1 Tax=Henosepilachna vigintioctopunctata TaxID=420089 RepID=A0AAW1TQL3_9CUCU
MADDAFQNAIQSYYEVFLKSQRVDKMVQSGACSQYDFRKVFRNNIEKRVRSNIPDIEDLSKNSVFASWMRTADVRGGKMIDPLSSEEGRDEKNGPSHGGHHPASHYHSSTHSHHNQTEVPPYHYTQLFDSGGGNLKVPNNSAALQRSLSPSIAVSAETISHSMGSSRAISLPRPTSPSPSVISEKTEVDLQENQEREE